MKRRTRSKLLKSQGPKEKFTDEKKNILASLVEERPCLWQITNSGYRKQDAQQAGWLEVGESLGVAVDVCKDQWRSLKEALRYQKGQKKITGKSGDAAKSSDDEETENPSFDEEQLKFWKHYDSMKFMIDRPSRRTTSSFPLESLVDNIDSANDIPSSETVITTLDKIMENTPMVQKASEDSLGIDDVKQMDSSDVSTLKRTSTNNYDYVKRPKKSNDASGEQQIVESIQSLIELRKTSTIHSGKDGKGADLKYYSMYANLDRMLEKLPEAIVEDLNFEFICQIRSKMKEMH